MLLKILDRHLSSGVRELCCLLVPREYHLDGVLESELRALLVISNQLKYLP